ncbi:MAG: DUF4198 domain-containing protein, partial [Desulfobacterales bacterium]|nr:DUF4198 domain-containing protein [Desulfobacterales bacterium]
MKFSPQAHSGFSLRGALLLIPILICLTASGALSHTLYIQSSRYLASEGKSIPFFFCYGHFIPV